MIDLDISSAFRSLSAAEQALLAKTFVRRHYPAGLVVCRQGDEGRALYLIESGGVAVELGSGAEGGGARIHLGPGQVFGEMSLLSGQPVSATVRTVRDTWFGVLDRTRFQELLASQPSLLLPFVQLLIERLRHRTGPQLSARVGELILAVVPEEASLLPMARYLSAEIGRYAPGSIVALSRTVAPDDARPADWPLELSPSPDGADAREAGDGTLWIGLPMRGEALRAVVERWRAAGEIGRFLLVVVGPRDARSAAELLRLGDAALIPADAAPDADPIPVGLADRAEYLLGPVRRPRVNSGPWYHLIDLDGSAPAGGSVRAPDDRLARWLTRRSVGVALGAGAALGFAHLGVLEILDEARIPVDYVCGTSMGGAVALAYACHGDAAAAGDAARDLVGSNRRVIDMAWVPRTAMLRGRKVERACLAMFGDRTLDQFHRASAVVAADLVRRERVVLDRGLASIAVRSTIAIPGLFPPVHAAGRILVDGALVNRIPLNLLGQQRCGLRIAVNVIPSPAHRRAQSDAREADLAARTGRILGLRHVIGEAWEMLGWWHGAVDAQSADVLIEPGAEGSGYDFGSIDRMIACGRAAAQAKLPEIERAATTALASGVP